MQIKALRAAHDARAHAGPPAGVEDYWQAKDCHTNTGIPEGTWRYWAHTGEGPRVSSSVSGASGESPQSSPGSRNRKRRPSAAVLRE